LATTSDVRLPILVLLLLLAAHLPALDFSRVIDEQGVQTLYARDGSVLAVEAPGAAGEALYFDALGRLMGSSRPDPVLGGRTYCDAAGLVVGSEVPNWSTGTDHFAADGTYRGMSVGGELGFDVAPDGSLLPAGLFPVPMHWTSQIGLSGTATGH
jgi:hypothetical protein